MKEVGFRFENECLNCVYCKELQGVCCANGKKVSKFIVKIVYNWPTTTCYSYTWIEKYTKVT